MRTVLVVSMLKEEELIGVFGIEREEVKPFTEKQIPAGDELCGPDRHRHRRRWWALASRHTRFIIATFALSGKCLLSERRVGGHEFPV